MSRKRDEMCKERDEESEEKWKKVFEILEHETKERVLQNELRTFKEERTRTENETSRNHTKQIKQLEAKARLECAEMRKEFEKKASELLKHQNKETGLQNELRMLREERTRMENETLRNHTVQIEQLEAKARLKNEIQERVVKEQGMKQKGKSAN